MTPESIFEPFEKQQQFIDAVFSGLYSYLIYGGAIRGGKTYLLLALLFSFCKIWPGSRWALVRKDLPTIKRNLLPVFNKLAPRPFVGKINKTDWDVPCINGSKIIFFPESIKDDPDLDRWKGLEVNGILYEEINEVQEKTLDKGIERAGSWLVPGLPEAQQPPPLILGTCNPAKNWIKVRVYNKWERGTLEPPWFYLPAKIKDNPYLTAQYIKSLENLPEPEYRRFVLGDWSAADEPDQLIKAEYVEASFDRAPLSTEEIEVILEADGVCGLLKRDGSNVPRRIGNDVARFGDDDTATVLTDAFHIETIDAHHGFNLIRTANTVTVFATEHGVDGPDIRIDTVGLGAGVADSMTTDGWPVVEFVAGAKATSKDWTPEKRGFLSFRNLRSEAWWVTREIFRLGLASVSPDISDTDKARLLADLTAPRYKVDGERTVAVESKEATKKRLGRSPDYGDGLIQAWAVLPKAQGFFLS